MEDNYLRHIFENPDVQTLISFPITVIYSAAKTNYKRLVVISDERVNPLTAGFAFIRFFIFHWHIKYHFLNMLKIKYDINQQDLKRVDLHFVKSE